MVGESSPPHPKKPSISLQLPAPSWPKGIFYLIVQILNVYSHLRKENQAYSCSVISTANQNSRLVHVTWYKQSLHMYKCLRDRMYACWFWPAFFFLYNQYIIIYTHSPIFLICGYLLQPLSLFLHTLLTNLKLLCVRFYFYWVLLHFLCFNVLFLISFIGISTFCKLP